jgi:hypothetical protein
MKNKTFETELEIADILDNKFMVDLYDNIDEELNIELNLRNNIFNDNLNELDDFEIVNFIL